MAGLLPETVRLRTDKTRLGAFLRLSLGGERRALVEEFLTAPLVEELGFINGERLRIACRAYQEGGADRFGGFIWYSIAMEAWLRKHERVLVADRSFASLPSAA
jgi:hypothetical protein